MDFDGRINLQREDVFRFSGLNSHYSTLSLHNKIKKYKCNQLNYPTYYQFASETDPIYNIYDDSYEVDRINYEK